jgi:hypothetical protein
VTEPVPAPARPAAASGSASAEFGSETLPKKTKPAAAEEVPELTAKVASVSGKRKGDYRITLDNGQVWAETQRTGGEPPQPGDTVTLRRGTMGSYFLSRGSGLALRVTRVK